MTTGPEFIEINEESQMGDDTIIHNEHESQQICKMG